MSRSGFNPVSSFLIFVSALFFAGTSILVFDLFIGIPESNVKIPRPNSHPYRGASIMLTQQEATDLRFLREEEKLTADLYTALYEKWKLPFFHTAAQAQQAYSKELVTLLENYKIPDPSQGKTLGNFEDMHLHKMYADLMTDGEKSLKKALLVMGQVEEIKVEDLDLFLSHSAQTSLLGSYKNIQIDARNNLRSLTAELKKIGVSYTAQHLPHNKLNFIITSGHERIITPKMKHKPAATKPAEDNLLLDILGGGAH
ncbi:DUF2202 domain-containing protein [Terasakiella sp. SH-1]|uniref:DUF2202 domain-containing protein n=1 Tax=Terasakiella sp. SH-1 TaxID=2560057 RepID=UPI001074946D|nr:DUF2202 domain-containing protein [Terasakiella sp. SH-1]